MKQVNILVVATQPHMPDVRGVALQHTLQDDLHLRVDEVRTASLYTIHAPLTRLTWRKPARYSSPMPWSRSRSGLSDHR